MIGAPLFIDFSSPELTSRSLPNVFQLNPNGFSLFFNSLNNAQKQAITKRIMSEYGVSVSTSQIITFKLYELSCTITIYCNNKPVEIDGKSDSLDIYPIEVKFNANRTTRACLTEYLYGIQLVKCDYVNYCQRSIDSELVSSSLLGQTDLIHFLFENDNEIFMTRQQLNDFAEKICLDFCQNYRPTNKSSINLNDFIHENNIEFEQVDFENGLNSLSKYIYIMKLNATEIKSMYESIFIVRVYKWKRLIAINEILTAKINKTLLTSFGIKKSYNYVSENAETWSKSTKSLDDQVNELNLQSRNDIEWKILGNKILPKSLNITKLVNKSSFRNGLRFKIFERVAGDFDATINFQFKDDGKNNFF